MRQSFHATSASLTCVLLLTNISGVAVLKGFVMLVLFLLVGRTARALGPFVDETGWLLRDHTSPELGGSPALSMKARCEPPRVGS